MAKILTKEEESTSSIVGEIREDLTGRFNEAFILKEYPDRFEHVLKNDVILPPFEVIIHPTSRCNLKCDWCIGASVSSSHQDRELNHNILPSNLADPENMQKLIQNLLNYKKEVTYKEDGKEVTKTYRIENVSFSGITGEPLAAKQSMITAIELLSKENIRIGLFSNATLLDDELMESILKLSYINISFDAGTPETFAKIKYRGLKQGESIYERLLENIQKLVKLRNQSSDSKLTINASFILYPSNYKEIYIAAKRLKDLGIDNFRMKLDISGNNLLSESQMAEAQKLIDQVDGLVDDKFKFFKVHRIYSPSDRIRTAKKCMITDFMGAISSDGFVYPCNYHPKVGAKTYGDAISNSFQEIWEGENRLKLKEQLPEICPAVCDPFKTRSNKLLCKIKDFYDEYGEKETYKLISQIDESPFLEKA